MNAFSIIEQWAETLVQDEALTFWISSQLGRQLTIYLGFDAVREFGSRDAPYLVMAPAGEETGPEREELVFDIALFMGVACETKPKRSGKTVTESSMHFMDTQFSPRILQALHDGAQDCVPELAEGQTYPARDGFCEREMVVSVRVPNTLNLKHAPWR